MNKFCAIIVCAAVWFACGCRSESALPDDARTRDYDAKIRARWGKGLNDLPTLKLVAISAHNENITDEFGWAFSLHHALEHGAKVKIEWRQVGGGGGSIQQYLTNVYQNADTAEIDVVWGGGDILFSSLSKPVGKHADGILQPINLPAETLEQIPPELAGQPLYDKHLRWVGCALSGFGFLYNAGMLGKCAYVDGGERRVGIPPPGKWDDLGDRRFSDLLTLADPGQSGSATQAYRMIVVSEPTWPAGWAKLMGVLSNAKRFSDSAGSAANAPVLGDALVATCIDFYGILRVAESPDQLVYVSPPGQTVFTPDPIAILKNPPNPELAQRFAQFVLSRQGQALWALRVGVPDGPVRSVLGRQPIRRDVYEIYHDQMSPRLVNPYEAGQSMQIAPTMTGVDFNVLRALIVAAAIDNTDLMRQARATLNSLQADNTRRNDYQKLLDEFNRLPDDVATIELMSATAKRMKDPAARERITRNWRQFFRDKFLKVAKRLA